jgi:hypothetical protein
MQAFEIGYCQFISWKLKFTDLFSAFLMKYTQKPNLDYQMLDKQIKIDVYKIATDCSLPTLNY